MYLGGFLLGLLSIGILKPAVTLVALWLVWRVYQARRGRPKAWLAALAGPQQRVSGALLGAGLALFLLSELTCGVEVYLLMSASGGLRLVHAYSSAFGSGLILCGMALAFDTQALHYFDQARPCFLARVCRACPARTGETCRFHSAFVWAVSLLVLTTVPPLFIPVRALPADPAAVSLPYPSLNTHFDETVLPALERLIPRWDRSNMVFDIPREMTLADFRHIPLVAAALGVLAIVLSWVRRHDRLALVMACLAAGAVAYAYLEAAVYTLIPYAYAGQLGHETAEIVGLIALSCVLHGVFGEDQ